MNNKSYQDMIEYDRIQLLIVPKNNQIRLYFSFNPFLNYHFVEKIKQEKSLKIKLISNPGAIICLMNKKFDYDAFFGKVSQYITANYEKFMLSN